MFAVYIKIARVFAGSFKQRMSRIILRIISEAKKKKKNYKVN